MANAFKMTDEEKQKILEKHKTATKNHYVKKEETKKGLQESVQIYRKLISEMEKATFPKSKILCEPFLTKYNLHPSISIKGTGNKVMEILHFISWCDGKHPLFEIAKKLNKSYELQDNEAMIDLIVEFVPTLKVIDVPDSVGVYNVAELTPLSPASPFAPVSPVSPLSPLGP